MKGDAQQQKKPKQTKPSLFSKGMAVKDLYSTI